jgi:hypothetical protein
MRRKNDGLGNNGRVRPFVVALSLIILGLLLHQWWWRVGGVIMIVLFIEAYFRYRSLD